MSADSSNPYVFVVGCPRSGTTLLQRMLDNHPSLAVSNDTHFIPRCLEKFAPTAAEDAARGADVLLTPSLAAGVRGYKRFPRLGVSDDEAREAESACATYGEFVSALYDRFAAHQGKPLAGEKTPDYVRRLPLLHAMFPHAKVVHIVRDGRDVALSVLDWASADKGPGKLELWAAEPIAACALWWRWQVRSGRDGGARLGPDRYLEVSYEALVAAPEQELRRISAFLELSFAPEMAAYWKGKMVRNPALSAKSAWLPPTSGLRDWRVQMQQRDIELFEALAGDLLDDLRMERAFHRISPAFVRIASGHAGWWRMHLARREAKERRRGA